MTFPPNEHKPDSEADQAARALQRKRSMLATVLQTLPTGVVIVDAQGQQTWDNAASRELWGVAEGEARWWDPRRLVGWWPDSGERIEPDQWPLFRAFRHGEVTRDRLIQYRPFNSDQKRFYLTNAVPLLDEQGNLCGAVAAMHDVTERRLAGLAKQRSEARFRAFVNASVHLLFRLSADSRQLWRLNEEGSPDREALQTRAWVRQFVHPEDRAPLLRALASARRDKRLFEYEHRVVLGDGKVVWSLSRAVPLMDERGEIIEWIGAAADVTQRRESDRRLTEANDLLERRVVERTAELHTLTEQLRGLAGALATAEQRERKRIAGLLHDDLQQTLVAAQRQLENLGQLDADARDERARRASGYLGMALDTCRQLTTQLRPPALYEDGLVPAFHWLASQMSERFALTVTCEAQSGGPALSDDAKAMLFEAVRELLFNTIKHASARNAYIRMDTDQPGLLRICVGDDGRGPGCESLEDMMQGRHGLFGIQERLADWGGGLTADLDTNAGVSFTLTLPLTGHALQHRDQQPDPPSGEKPLPRPTDGAGTVRMLVVDDHQMVREGVVYVLEEDERIEVVGEASDGVEALQAVANTQPDVVLMDLNMPRINGIQVTREIMKHWPNTRVVGFSVQDDHATEQAMLDAGAVAFLSKSSNSDKVRRVILHAAQSQPPDQATPAEPD